MVRRPQVQDRGGTRGKEACLFWQHLVSCSFDVRDPRTAMRASTGLLLGSTHVHKSTPDADGTSHFSNSVRVGAGASLVDRAGCRMGRALQAAHRSQRGAEGETKGWMMGDH